MHLDFINGARDLTRRIDAPELLALARSLTDDLVGDFAQFIQTGFPLRQLHQLGFNQIRTRQFIGFVNQHFHTHGIEQLSPAIDTLRRRRGHREQFFSQRGVFGHGVEHAPDLGGHVHPKGDVMLEVIRLGQLADLVEKWH
ncbi:hypothetical protein D3C84_1000670 [compost metagenome]